jgi:mevalonate kinase
MTSAMTVKLSCPSKTFLIGEYAALQGFPALILNTFPRFELLLEQTGTTEISIFHKDSPAGRWLRERAPLLEGWKMTFTDPHNGRGGFGASSAQFLLSHCATTFLQISEEKAREGFDMQAVWNDFQVLSQNASGYDVLAQSVGGVAHVETGGWILQNLPWKFQDLMFSIVRTGGKTQTHVHIREIAGEEFADLGEISTAACVAFEEGQQAVFLAKIKEFSDHLSERGLIDPLTVEILDDANRNLQLKAVRGCGALGADTILFIYTPEQQTAVKEFIARRQLEVVAETQDLAHGIDIEWSGERK